MFSEKRAPLPAPVLTNSYSGNMFKSYMPGLLEILPDLTWEAVVCGWLLPLLVDPRDPLEPLDPGLPGTRGGDSSRDLGYPGNSPKSAGGTYISSKEILPLDSTRPGVDWLLPIAAESRFAFNTIEIITTDMMTSVRHFWRYKLEKGTGRRIIVILPY